jgi:hypothetical protein
MNLNEVLRKKAERKLSEELKNNWSKHLDKISLRDLINTSDAYDKGHDLQTIFNNNWGGVINIIVDKMIDDYETNEVTEFSGQVESSN